MNIPDKKKIAEDTARIYLDTGAVRFMTDKPFIFTSGWASPVYNDSRWLISFPRERTHAHGLHGGDDRARHRPRQDRRRGRRRNRRHSLCRLGRRTAWPADAIYPQEAKGFGRGAQIEGKLDDGQRVLLVEDLATDGKSKVNFVKAIREAGGKCDHCIVIFFYDIYPQGKRILGDLGVTLHQLTTWWDVLAVAKASNKFDKGMLAEVESFMKDPAGWSKAHGGASEAAE